MNFNRQSMRNKSLFRWKIVNPYEFYEYFGNLEGESESHQQRCQVQQHARKSFIVLSRRKGQDDLEQDPDELVLSPKLLYDDAGYFIDISSMIDGLWQPCYSLYETNDEVHAIIELAGFKKGVVKVQVVEEAIIITGCRTDFKNELTNPTAHQEEIPLQSKINSDSTTMERDEGCYRMKCPKKIVVAKTLE
jgi:HSP20 family molecular chaperone IbpA